MDAPATAEIRRILCEIPEFRRPNRLHKLPAIITIAIFAVIRGADDGEEVAAYGRRKRKWLETFLDLPHGIPSRDTFGRVFARCFNAWMSGMVELGGGKLIAIDGKSLRQSFEHGWDKSGMVHLVSAFVAGNKMVFGQVKTGGKGQELDGIERLLKLLDLKGAVVSIGALGCNRKVVELILEGEADYLLQAKDKQPTRHRKLKLLMGELILEHFAGTEHGYFTETNGGHGRIETRRVWVCWNGKDLGPVAENWPGLRTLVVVEEMR